MIKLHQSRWVIMAENRLILCYRGFNSLNLLNSNSVRLFPTLSSAKVFIEESKYAECKSITYHKVSVNIEEVLE